MNRTPLVILGIPIDNFTMEETVAYVFHLMDRYRNDRKPKLVCTVNTDFVVNTMSWSLKKTRHHELLRILREADLVTADGMPLVWASRFLGSSLKERVTGADLVPRIAQEAACKDKSLYFLGGRPGSAEKASEILKVRYPGLKIAGCDSPFVHTEGSKLAQAYEEDEAVIERINASQPDILFIAFGNPKQEIWFERNRGRLKVPVSIGIGGTFDFITGSVARAPLWMRESGLEWLFRFTQDPWRLWKRYLIDSVKLGIMIWPSIILYQYTKKVAPHSYLKKCKSKVSYKYMSRKGQEILVITLPGIIDTETVTHLAAITPRRPASHLILDFSDVAFVDSSGLGLLLQIMLLWTSFKFEVLLVGTNQYGEKCMIDNRLYDLLPTRQYAGLEEALAYLDTMSRRKDPYVEFSEEGAVSTIRISGNLTRPGISFREIRSACSLSKQEKCVIDLAGLNSIDNLGIIYLFKLKEALLSLGKTCTVTGMSGNVAQMLKITKVKKLF